MWHVLQTDVFGGWFGTIDEAAKVDIYSAIRVLSEVGPSLGRPRVDTVKSSEYSNMKELRVQSKGRPYRIFFAFDPKRNIVLLVGGNKQGNKRFYEQMVSIADKLYAVYLKDGENE
jgi:hypothetical protein